MLNQVYTDRREAGEVLAGELVGFRRRADVVVLAIPRGGVPVGYEVARALGLPLDVIVVRKLGVPFEPELAMGAIASGGVRVLNPDVQMPPAVVDEVTRRELKVLERRERTYRHGRTAVDLAGRAAILVDDGLATGSSMRAAIASVRKRRVSFVVVAVPVGARSTCDEIAACCDRLVCPLRTDELDGVGRWYQDFTQVSDEEVRGLLLELAPAVGS